ncbi:hypothetical protein ACK83U_16875 [Rhizobium sp. WW22]|jgi:hypothetical protein|uniref:Uncharacterized protein n=1 Tax=Rhizobium miluonense TaxID=411945 RepID=A0ABU1SYQ9_9HYPH|nr:MULTISPECIES: hypothetical protein [Rhizobium]MBB3386562.1 hypothetical protein [Rhizobium sp. BK098]MBB3618266.1 hypothetical protein [Rhizobium sp. BK609]MBB3683923.1 hypothetical protein [Rhizobium sp. BK612]MDR6904124.1 hypothetical protein [Rhizobium miluonense]
MNKPIAFHTFKDGRNIADAQSDIPLIVTSKDVILVGVSASNHLQSSPITGARS